MNGRPSAGRIGGEPVRAFRREKLAVRTFGTVEDVGAAAADLVQGQLRTTIAARGSANLVLATGTSQLSFLDALRRREIDWSRVSVFHLDEYIGLTGDHPASFRRYLKERILDAVRPGEVHLIGGDAPDLEAEIARYESLLTGRSLDVACIGIGENGHIAFNDPPVADFDDPRLVKEVELDDACRRQQVNEGWFPSFAQTPRRAITLTVPAIMACRVISCVVPGARKVEAVRAALNGPVSTACPASVLRRHDNATLFLDSASGEALG